MARLIETITETQDYGPDCKTAEEMEQICCEPTSALQCCEIGGPWDGYTAEEVFEKLGLDLDNEGRDSQGRYVYIEFAPRINPCGEKVIDYDLTPGNCCDDVAPIEADQESTPDVLPAGQSINIYFDGGRYPITATTSSAETHFPNNKKQIELSGGTFVTLIATEFFCGSTAVKFSDGCSDASLGIRSDKGRWEAVGSLCVLSGAEPTAGIGPPYEAVRGMWKQIELAGSQLWHGYGAYCDPREFFPEVQAEGCLSGIEGGCEKQYCDYLVESRPPGTENDICLGIDPQSYSFVSSVICILNDGAVVGTHSLLGSSFGVCVYKNSFGGRDPIQGTKTLHAGFYRKTQELQAYRWVC